MSGHKTITGWILHQLRDKTPLISVRRREVLLSTVILLSCFVRTGLSQSPATVSLKDECLKTMVTLADTLLQLQISQTQDRDHGAQNCPSCKVLHTRAADYLARVMDPEFASINYCTTTTATLALMNRYFPNPAHLAKARLLARQVVSKMDDDGFIQAKVIRRESGENREP